MIKYFDSAIVEELKEEAYRKNFTCEDEVIDWAESIERRYSKNLMLDSYIYLIDLAFDLMEGYE